MLDQQHHQIRSLIQIWSLIQLWNLNLLLRSSFPSTDKLWLCESYCDEMNETLISHTSCGTFPSCHVCVWTHISSDQSFCLICETCLKNYCENSLTCFQFPSKDNQQ